jgi:hypothetical protein
MNQMHKNDFGTEIVLTITTDGVPQNIGSSRARSFDFEAPSGSTFTRTATYKTDGTDGKLKYISQADDFDEAGTWKVQAYVEFGPDLPAPATSKLKSDVVAFFVKDNIL